MPLHQCPGGGLGAGLGEALEYLAVGEHRLVFVSTRPRGWRWIGTG
jgi:hypothetical protein